MSVLVVDDDATVVNLVTAVLHRAGIEAEVALDGPSALARLERGRYRAVLSDLTMPGMSGLQMLRAARERGCTLPFLIMTAYLVPEAETALRSEPGVAGVLRKPFDIRRLVEEVAALLKSAGGASSEDIAPTSAAPEPASEPAAAPAAVHEPPVSHSDVEPAQVGMEEAAWAEPSEVLEVAEPAELETVVEVAAACDAAVRADVVHAFESREPLAVRHQVSRAESLLPLSLKEYVTARLVRQALIARAERRAAALRSRPLPTWSEAGAAQAPVARQEAGRWREAEQGC